MATTGPGKNLYHTLYGIYGLHLWHSKDPYHTIRHMNGLLLLDQCQSSLYTVNCNFRLRSASRI